MAHTPSQLVLLNFASQPLPFPLPSSGGEYTRNSVHVYDGEEPYSDPAVYESMYNAFHLTDRPRTHIS